MYVISAHQRHGQTDRQTDGRTSSDPMTATLLKHVAVKTVQKSTKDYSSLFIYFVTAKNTIVFYTVCTKYDSVLADAICTCVSANNMQPIRIT